MYSTNIIKYITGRYGIVGSVPMDLAYQQVDGRPLTDRQAEIIKHCGPGLLKGKVRAVTFQTLAEAEAKIKD